MDDREIRPPTLLALEFARHSQAEFLQVLSEPERHTLIGLLRRVLRADDEARLRTRVAP